MNEVIKQLHARKSVRAFEDRPIGESEKRAILEAAVQAPTAGNQQLYTIIDVQDETRKSRLAESCDHQPFISKAPLVLVFLADVKKWYDAFRYAGASPRKPGVGDLFIALDDALIAAQNAVVAAESLGIGSCYIGDIMENCEEQRDILGLPEYVFPAALLVFGYPTEQQKERHKPNRVPLDYVVHRDTYHAMGEDELQSMFAGKVANTALEGNSEEDENRHAERYREWMLAFCNRKYNSDFSREMTRSVAEFLKDYE